MNDENGRARVFAQWDDTEEEINLAIESCPVNCIFFIEESKLPILEFATTTIK
jgi:ferredoxin